MEKYNGWTNRETWLVNLWFDPVSKSDIDYLEETIESDFYELIGTSASIYADMIDFNVINWDELRDYYEDEE
tara:strand:- start:486 stop:701 length:216 start_codon:yes stop_codon:yes gene_type:complete